MKVPIRRQSVEQKKIVPQLYHRVRLEQFSTFPTFGLENWDQVLEQEILR